MAEELGIDIEDLTLLPTERDLTNFPSNEKSMKQAQLQADAYPSDSDVEGTT